MSGSQQLNADVDIDIAGLLGEVWRKKLLVVTLVACTAAILALFLTTVDPRYRSSARLIIEKRESVFTRPNEGDFSGASGQFDEQAIGSQVQIISSDQLALSVIDRLHLPDAREFGGKDSSLLGDLMSMIGLSRTGGGFSRSERMLEKFRHRLTVFAPEKSRVIVIEFWANDPKIAQAVPNALADAYLEFNRQAKLSSTEEATEWLAPEIDELRLKLREAEAKVAEFRANSDILVGNNNALLATQQLSETSSELSRVRAERSAAEGKIGAIRSAVESGGSLDVIPEVIASPLIQRLREREAAFQAQISELSTSLLPGHPRLKALQSQAKDMRGQIVTAARNILVSLENNVDLYAKQESVLVERLNQLKAESARVGEAEVELRALEREATAQRELLESYLTQYREAASRQNRQYLPVDARIISRAVLPVSSYFPKRIAFTVAGSLTMAILAVVGILAWALLTGKALKPAGRLEPSMVPEALATADIASPPRDEHPYPHAAAPQSAREPPAPGRRHTTAGPPAQTPAAPATGPAPSYGERLPPSRPAPTLNEPLTFNIDDTLAAILEIGSSHIAGVSPSGESGSLVVQYLARALSEFDRSVIIVDLTGTAVTSRVMLGDVRLDGLRDMLAGTAGFDTAIHLDSKSSAHVLPLGRDSSAAGPHTLNHLARIARTLGENYDYVIFDCGFAGPEGLSGIADSDWVVLVSGTSDRDRAAFEFERRFRQAGYDETIIVTMDDGDRTRLLRRAA